MPKMLAEAAIMAVVTTIVVLLLRDRTAIRRRSAQA